MNIIGLVDIENIYLIGYCVFALGVIVNRNLTIYVISGIVITILIIVDMGKTED